MPQPDIELDFQFQSDVDLTRPEFMAQIEERVRSAIRDYPDSCCEGSITLGGIEHYYTCRTISCTGNYRWRVEFNIQPREDAEKLLNEHGLSTHEPFNPLPGAGNA
jgi:hypothetical protein